MEVLVGLPYLRDFCKKARSGCFEPFVRYESFPVILGQKRGEKKENPKKNKEEEINIYSYKRREEKRTEKKRRNITNLAA